MRAEKKVVYMCVQAIEKENDTGCWNWTKIEWIHQTCTSESLDHNPQFLYSSYELYFFNHLSDVAFNELTVRVKLGEWKMFRWISTFLFRSLIAILFFHFNVLSCNVRRSLLFYCFLHTRRKRIEWAN